MRFASEEEDDEEEAPDARQAKTLAHSRQTQSVFMFVFIMSGIVL